MVSIPQKRCSKCGEFKPATPEYFSRNKNCKDGLHVWCKPCSKQYAKVHPEASKKANDKFNKSHPTARADAVRRYRQNHPERKRQQKRDYAKNHPDKIRA